jgi:hypothetical protein
VAKVARYQIDGELYCGVCTENIGGSFIEKKRFVDESHKCPGCDTRSLCERLADQLYPIAQEAQQQ